MSDTLSNFQKLCSYCSLPILTPRNTPHLTVRAGTVELSFCKFECRSDYEAENEGQAPPHVPVVPHPRRRPGYLRLV